MIFSLVGTIAVSEIAVFIDSFYILEKKNKMCTFSITIRTTKKDKYDKK